MRKTAAAHLTKIHLARQDGYYEEVVRLREKLAHVEAALLTVSAARDALVLKEEIPVGTPPSEPREG